MTESKHTPGPWEWEEACHTSDYRTSQPRTLVSRTVDQIAEDGRNLGRKPVLIPTAAVRATQAEAITNISLEIHGAPEDESLIAAAPELLEACKLVCAHPVAVDGKPWQACATAIAKAEPIARGERHKEVWHWVEDKPGKAEGTTP